jgi:ribosome-associated toxin RatA of RatAB toxin-antitoxin module
LRRANLTFEDMVSISAYPAARPARLLQWLLLGCVLVGASTAWAHENIMVEAVWDGELVAVSASAELDAGAAAAWSVLTDYEHYADFIPDMAASRIVSHKPDGMVVEHTGEFRFLFFRRPMHLLLEVVLDPPRRIVAHSLSGDLRDLSSSYEISELPQALHLSYKARFLPGFSLPPFIGLVAVRHAMELQFTAIVREIVRRSALSGGYARSQTQRLNPQ